MDTPSRRLFRRAPRLWLAGAVSVLLHGLWLGKGWLPFSPPAPPPAETVKPLTARLVVLSAAPSAAAVPPPPTATRPATGTVARLGQRAASAHSRLVPVPPSSSPSAAPSPDSATPSTATSSPAAETASPAPSPSTVSPTLSAPLAAATFPAQVNVGYEIRYGNLAVGLGEAVWREAGGRYTLTLTLRPLIGARLTYTSQGEVTAKGIRPQRFEARRGSTLREHADFDWAAGELRYGDGEGELTVRPLQAGAQDIVSFAFQLALQAGRLEGETVQMTTGKKVYDQPIVLDGEADLPLTDQTLRGVRVSSTVDTDRTEVWLAPDFYNLPLRIRRSGDKQLEQRAVRITVGGKTLLEKLDPPHGN